MNVPDMSYRKKHLEALKKAGYLERQLEKAREEEIKFLNGLYIYEHNIPTISEIRYRILKLKEKGENE